MMKRIFLAFLFLVLYSACAMAHPTAVIWGESHNYVTSDNIMIICSPQTAYCKETMWYYFSPVDCSSDKTAYANSIEGQLDDFFLSISAWVNADCTNENDKYLCLWVEDTSGQSDRAQSKELKIDCTAPSVVINSPTTLDPLTKIDNDSAEVSFTVTEARPRNYTVRITGQASDNTICSESDNINASGSYTRTCSWQNATDGTYDVTVEVTDISGNRTTARNNGALIINTPRSPYCGTGWIIYIYGNTNGVQNAFSLTDMCHDPNNDALAFSNLDYSACSGLIESVTVDGENKVSIGKPLKNEEIVGESESCNVTFGVTDGSFTRQGSFGITVFKVGKLELRIRQRGQTQEFDADTDWQKFDVTPGQQACFDLVLQNGLPKVFKKPLDLVFILDASGSMQQEIDAVRDTITLLSSNIQSLCTLPETTIEHCFKLGAVIIEGHSPNSNFPQMDFTEDYDAVEAMLASIATNGSAEPWADYIINTIDAGAAEPRLRTGAQVVPRPIFPMSWRYMEDATKMVILITDASNENQGIKPPDAHNNPKSNYKVNQIAGYANPKGIIVSGIGIAQGVSPCDPSGCPLYYNGSQLQGEMIDAANASNGIAVVYTIPEEIQSKIMEVLWAEVLKDTAEIKIEEGPEGWLTAPLQPMVVNRGGGIATQEVCFNVPSNASSSTKFDFSATVGTFTDLAKIELVPGASTVIQANPGGPYAGREGVEVSFDGSASADVAGPIDSWTWDFGDSTTGNGETVTHIYGDNGTYNVSLTVSGPSGTATASTTANIANIDPIATIHCNGSAGSCDRAQVLVGDTLHLQGTAEDVPADMPALQYAWDLDDDGTFETTGQVAEKIWSSAGQFRIGLRVSDKDGGQGYAYAEVAVLPSGDVFEIKKLETLKNGADSHSFEQKDSPMTVRVTVLNKFYDELSSSVTISIKTIENTVIHSEQISNYWFAPGETVLPPVDIDISGLQSWQNYIVEASIEKAPFETVTLNNSKRKTIGLGFKAVPVPETAPLLVALAAFAVLFIACRKK